VSRRATVEIDGRRLHLSNLDKVLYPQVGFTKAQVIDYYARIAPVLLPHLRGRPLTLKRYPNGVEGPHFYEKRCPGHRPKWVRTAPIFSRGKGEAIPFCVADDLATLVWAANLADLELHPYLHRADAPDRPTLLAFDLDPGPPAGLQECLEVAVALRRLFERLGLECFPKTSGSKGLQVYLPLNSATSYAKTKPFARAVAEALERAMPKAVVSNMKKELRGGKVLVDWSQNDEHKTTVCVYSLRAKARPTVSTPITWDELEHARARRDMALLTFEAEQVLERVARQGDLFAPVLELRQRLPEALRPGGGSLGATRLAL
jgi:bifunctional non-homologous end joining protein LigD